MCIPVLCSRLLIPVLPLVSVFLCLCGSIPASKSLGKPRSPGYKPAKEASMKRILTVAFVLVLANLAQAQSSSKPSWRPLRNIEDSLLFHPQTASQRWFQVPPQIKVEDVWLRSSDGDK